MSNRQIYSLLAAALALAWYGIMKLVEVLL